MKLIDAGGVKLNPMLFIEAWRQIKNLAPPRFLTLRLHSNRMKEITEMAQIPMSIQVGQVAGHLGRKITKVACIQPPLGVNDGIRIVEDDKMDPTKLVFEIHGNAEMVVENLAP